MKTILIVEDDLTFRLVLKTWLEKRGFNILLAKTLYETKKSFANSLPDMVISDIRLSKDNGITILKWIKSNFPNTHVIMMTSYANIQSAVQSIKLGAYDYIAKPFNPEELLIKINELSKLSSQKSSTNKNKPQPEVTTEISSNFITGTSEKHKKLYEFINLVAPTKLSVLIQGESGVGKEHVARLIHEKSNYSNGPFVAVDCGVISKELAASDFFGHIKGAFTGAIDNKTGYFLAANQGTLFLDEIGNLPIDIQIQLLRVLQDMKIKPVGSEKEIEVDVRIVTATNEDVELAVNNGNFRTDLYHRISEFVLDIPALKESKCDIPKYLKYFLDIANKSLKKNVIDFSPEAIDLLTEYDWPGNIRELKNIVNRLTLLCQEDLITIDLIPDYIKSNDTN